MEWSRLGELVFVKLGGSIITDKLRPATPRTEAIGRLAQEIRDARNARPELRLLLGHGSGSFGHIVGQKHGVRQGIAEGASWQGYAETAAAAGRLNRIAADILLQRGVPVVSIQPSASARCQDGKLVSMAAYAVCEALRHGLVPLVYGDVSFDEARGCTIISTEQVLAYLARALQPARIVLVGEVDGVYDRDPLVDPGATQIPFITPCTFSHFEALLGGSHGVDVTGGMLSKVQEMVSLVAQGSVQRVHLISGKRVGALARVLGDPDVAEGTVIAMDGRRSSSS